LVYLALAAFGGRPRFSDLPPDLQHDTRDLFGNYREACAQADKLLFRVGSQEAVDVACRTATVGKFTPEALYIHMRALDSLSPLLRVYVGCAEMLTG
jgi:DNA phosphorothioation-associated putative methyltransferase